MTETIVLDAAGIAINRTALDITSWVAGDGPNWGDSEIQAYMSDAAVGSSPVDYRIPNRVISIPLRLRTLGATTFATIRSNIESKVGLFQREGGWIMRQAGATPLYADIVNATLHLGGSWLQAYRDVDIDAVLTLECIPDWYGDELQLSDHVETTLPHLIFTESTVNGNHPGRVRLVVDNDQATDQLGLLWGFQARNYNAGTTAALFYEAEALVPLNGGTVGALSGASGGTAVFHSTLPGTAWVPMLQAAMVGGTTPLTHAGSYRAWARCYAGGTFLPQFQLQWGGAGLSVPQTNDPIRIPGTAAFYMLDLGELRLDPPPVGPGQWAGVVQVQTTVANDPVAIDNIYFQPLDESAGKLTYVNVPPASSIQFTGTTAGTVADDSLSGSQTWTNPSNAKIEDTNYATVPLTGQTSHWLKATNYFAIPATATIKGFQILVYMTYTGGSNFSTSAKPVKAGTVQTSLSPATITWETFGTDLLSRWGGPTDLWGTTWTASDINNSGFGCAVQMIAAGASLVMVNCLQMTVWVTLASGLTVAQDAVIYASKTAELRTDGMFRQASGGTIYGPISNVIGDLPRIPPSGLEARTVRTFIKASRGNFDQLADAGIDDISARITYRPSYLVTP